MKQIMIALAVCVLILGAVSVSQGGNLADYYDDYLTAACEKCAGKCCFLNSRCCALREYAMKNQAKAEFLKNHKEELIEKMIAADVGQKPYKIDYFLTSEFGAHQRGQR
jgi:hypothetical protein